MRSGRQTFLNRLICVFLCMIACFMALNFKAMAQSETSQFAAEPASYQSRAFAMEGIGSFAVGPIVPTLYGNLHLLGDWRGLQPWLIQHGSFVYVAPKEEYLGNVTGGRNRVYVLARHGVAAVWVN